MYTSSVSREVYDFDLLIVHTYVIHIRWHLDVVLAGTSPPVGVQLAERTEQSIAVDMLHTLCSNTAGWSYKQAHMGRHRRKEMTQRETQKGVQQHAKRR